MLTKILSPGPIPNYYDSADWAATRKLVLIKNSLGDAS